MVVVSPEAVAWTAVLSDGLSARIVSAVEGKTRAYSFGTGRHALWTSGVVWIAMVSRKVAGAGGGKTSSMEGLRGGLGDEGMLGSCCGERHVSWDRLEVVEPE